MMKKPKDKEVAPESFDACMEKLRSTVEKMEQGDLSLDDGLKLFEEGIGLAGKLFEILNKAEGKVQELLADMERVPFERTDEPE
ncbi:MAG: exodeoxyribonuclease VII small subunit [Pseudomonadota bacterium]